MRGELRVLKPHLRGRWTRSGKILWHCRIYQRIGEMQVLTAQSREHYTPARAYKRALAHLGEPSPFMDALRRVVGA